MKGKAYVFRILCSIEKKKLDLYNHCHFTSSFRKAHFYCATTINATKISPHSGVVPEVVEEVAGRPKGAAEVLRKWGCSESDITMIFHRQPTLRNAIATHLESKLTLLSHLGVGSTDLVKMINCRPRFLSCRLNRYFDERLDDLQSLLGPRDVFLKAIVRNPSLLVYDFHQTVKPVISLYEQMGLSRNDLISMLLLRPTLIQRTKMTEEKLEYIHRTGVSKLSKMYKYVVTIIGISRIETIREKVANLEKFGFSEDEVLELFGRSPLLMTLSVEKVQRNMTFVVGTMKLPEKSVVSYPFLLFASLEAILKPRVLLAGKIQDMGLHPQIKGPLMFRALRMSEKRFLKVFVMCHQTDVIDELSTYYTAAKGMKRLAESSKKNSFTSGFPF